MASVVVFSGSVVKFKRALKTVLSQAVHEDTVHLSLGIIIQQDPRIAGRQFLSRRQIAIKGEYFTTHLFSVE